MDATHRAREILQAITEMARAGVETRIIVERAATDLRRLVEHEMNATERTEYVRRIVAGEPVMRVLLDISRRER